MTASSRVGASTRRRRAVGISFGLAGAVTVLAFAACSSTTRDAVPAAAPNSDGGPAGTQDGAPDVLDALDAAAAHDSAGDALARCVLQIPADSATSTWARIGADGQLSYTALPTGDTILDFSYAGYRGGGVALPLVASSKTVSPSGGDDTAAIQQAIDAVSAQPLVNGVRGAVVLATGTFELAGSLTIAASGVVLRGAGSGANGTTVHATGTPRTLLTAGGSGTWATTGAGAAITDSYVPSGARTVHVSDATALSVGQSVLVQRPVTEAWIAFMGMADLWRNDASETWLAPGTVIHADRTIVAIEGNAVTLDAPLSDSFDAKYTSASVVPYTYPTRVEEVGIEGLHVTVPSIVTAIDVATFQLLEMDALQNGWVRDVSADDVVTGIVLGEGVKWVTVDGANITRTTALDGSAGWPFHFSVAGQQTLIMRSSSSATGTELFPYATQARTSGPNVVLDLTVSSTAGASLSLQPHQRWATGLLADGVQAKGADIDFINRGILGSGHGWTMGFGVVWNSVASTLTIERPPGTMNWAIGSSGTFTLAEAPGLADAGDMPQGTIDSKGTPVAPASLYLAQLCERLGPSAVSSLGFAAP